MFLARCGGSGTLKELGQSFGTALCICWLRSWLLGYQRLHAHTCHGRAPGDDNKYIRYSYFFDADTAATVGLMTILPRTHKHNVPHVLAFSTSTTEPSVHQPGVFSQPAAVQVPDS
jgi:hypothetical protein